MMANPDSTWSGGGFNGDVLTLEIRTRMDANPALSLAHELCHAFMAARRTTLKQAARATPRLDEETLGEGLAYALSPGIYHRGTSDELSNAAARSWKPGWRD